MNLSEITKLKEEITILLLEEELDSLKNLDNVDVDINVKELNNQHNNIDKLFKSLNEYAKKTYGKGSNADYITSFISMLRDSILGKYKEFPVGLSSALLFWLCLDFGDAITTLMLVGSIITVGLSGLAGILGKLGIKITKKPVKFLLMRYIKLKVGKKAILKLNGNMNLKNLAEALKEDIDKYNQWRQHN